jgi:hypothetical protein
MLRWLFSRENLSAFLITVLILLVIILATDSSPQWIYQGF